MTDLKYMKNLGAPTLKKLRDAGVRSVEQLAATSSDQLISFDMSEAYAQKCIAEASKIVVKTAIRTGLEIYEERKTMKRLKVGVPEVDELLGGGLEPKNIAEIYGEFGSGKTQLAHQMAVNVQLPEDLGGLHGGCIYVDTENTFKPNRILQMVDGVNARLGTDLDGMVVLEHIVSPRAKTADQQVALINIMREAAMDRAKDDYPVRLIIIDSLTANFRAEYTGREQLATRQQKLGGYMHGIAALADEFDAVALMTNQVMSSPGVFFGDPTRPIGGNIVGHTSKTRCYIRKAKGGTRLIKLVDSPDLPDGEARLQVVEGGLIAVE